MSRPDEGLIHAWLDGELEPTEAARVQKLTESDPEWMAAVAEARGLIAASSRIVRALDAVPGSVLPSRSARAPRAARGFRVRPWMGVAAGLVLVVGTAYVMRESTEEAFGPAAVVVPQQPAEQPAEQPVAPPSAAPSDMASGERREAAAPMRDQPVGPLRQTVDDVGRVAAGAGSTSSAPPLSSQPAPVTIAPPSPASALAPPPRAPVQALTPSAPPVGAARAPAAKSAADIAAEEDRSLARLRSGSDRLSQVVVTGVAEAAKPSFTLAGCWRATAPDSLAALYRDLVIVRSAGDTLEVVLPNTRTVLVIRDRDTLRGGLTAVREVCPTRS